MINFTAGRVTILYNVLNYQQRSVHRVLGSVSAIQDFIIATLWAICSESINLLVLAPCSSILRSLSRILCCAIWLGHSDQFFQCIPCSLGNGCTYGQLSHLDHWESSTQLSPKYLSQIPLCWKYRQVIRCPVCNCLDSQDHLALPSQIHQHAFSDVSTWPYICTFILKINVIFSCPFLLQIRLMKATNLDLSQWGSITVSALWKCILKYYVVGSYCRLLGSPGLRPKRTLRTVLWSAEEPGGVGAAQYFQQHKVYTSLSY